MGSFSSGALSSDDSRNSPMLNGYNVSKFKPRKVFAVRDFPPKCGRNAVPVNSKGLDQMDSKIFPDKNENFDDGENIKFRGRKVCDIRDFPPMRRMNVDLPTEDRFVDDDDELETLVSNGFKDVIDNSVKDAGRRYGKKIVDRNYKVMPRDNDFTAEKNKRRQIVYGLMAAPYCPWGKGKVAGNNRVSGGKTKQLKRKSESVTPLYLVRKHSGGPSKGKEEHS